MFRFISMKSGPARRTKPSRCRRKSADRSWRANFQDGADVKKGDLLFSIDPRPYEAALDQAQGQLAQAKSQLVLDQAR